MTTQSDKTTMSVQGSAFWKVQGLVSWLVVASIGCALLAFISWATNYGTLGQLVEVFAVTALVIGIFAADFAISEWADRKGQSKIAFLLFAIFLGPLIALVVVVILRPISSHATYPFALNNRVIRKEDVLSRLNRLEELKSKNLITKAEFKTKKKALKLSLKR